MRASGVDPGEWDGRNACYRGPSLNQGGASADPKLDLRSSEHVLERLVGAGRGWAGSGFGGRSAARCVLVGAGLLRVMFS